MSENREIGTVDWFDHRRGYGFIKREGADLFVHHSQASRDLKSGDRVEFSLDTDRAGLPWATNVQVVGSQAEVSR